MKDDEAEEVTPMSVSELSRSAKLSASLIRLAIDCGCPTQEGKLSHFALLEWLSSNYEQVRAVTGLAPLPPVTTTNRLDEAQRHARNLFLTILDYSASRSSQRERKQAYKDIRDELAAKSRNSDEV